MEHVPGVALSYHAPLIEPPDLVTHPAEKWLIVGGDQNSGSGAPHPVQSGNGLCANQRILVGKCAINAQHACRSESEALAALDQPPDGWTVHRTGRRRIQAGRQTQKC